MWKGRKREKQLTSVVLKPQVAIKAGVTGTHALRRTLADVDIHAPAAAAVTGPVALAFGAHRSGGAFFWCRRDDIAWESEATETLVAIGESSNGHTLALDKKEALLLCHLCQAIEGLQSQWLALPVLKIAFVAALICSEGKKGRESWLQGIAG